MKIKEQYKIYLRASMPAVNWLPDVNWFVERLKNRVKRASF